MSIVPYNSNTDVLYHNPNEGILILHDTQENTIQLLSESKDTDSTHSTYRRYKQRSESGSNISPNLFSGTNFQSAFPKNSGTTECPNCGFQWTEYLNHNRSRRSSANKKPNLFGLSESIDLPKNFFMHNDYFKLLGQVPYKESASIPSSTSIPEGVFNQGYFDSFFKEVDPFVLGSGAHAQVFKVVHVLNGIELGIYAVKRISIGDKFELLEQVLNEVLILYELSVKGANENNLIRYNHVWLEMGDIKDAAHYVLPMSNEHEKSKNIPYVYILQQYCDGGHLEDLICKNYTLDQNLSMKDKVYREKMKRRAEKHGQSTTQSKKWLTDFEIWKMFHDVANGVHYLHKHGILHRDLKPSNCLLDVKYSPVEYSDYFDTIEDFESKVFELPKVLVSDFGEGKFIELQSNIRVKQDQEFNERRGNTGTLEFTSPKLWVYANDPKLMDREDKTFVNDFTYESDIYSLGLILCHLCCGELPFSDSIQNEDDPQEIRNKISKWYFDLTYKSFAEWFRTRVYRIQGSFSGCMSDYQELVYSMLKAEDKSITLKDVLIELNDVKWRRFIKSDGKSKEDTNLTLYEPIPSKTNQQEIFDDEEDFEFEADDENHLNLTEDEVDRLGKGDKFLKSLNFQIGSQTRISIYCIQLILLELSSLLSSHFSKSMLRLTIIAFLIFDISIIQSKRIKTRMFTVIFLIFSYFFLSDIYRYKLDTYIMN